MGFNKIPDSVNLESEQDSVNDQVQGEHLNDSLPVIEGDAGTGSNPDQIGEQKDP